MMEGSRFRDEGLTSPQRRAFDLARKAARKAVRRRFRVLRIVRQAYSKLGRHRSESAVMRISRDLGSMIRLVRSWASREYTEVPWKTVVYIVAAIIYFINPVDLIPDVLTGIGFVDDAAVVTAVVRSVADDLAAFRQWERQRPLQAAAVTELHPAGSAAA